MNSIPASICLVVAAVLVLLAAVFGGEDCDAKLLYAAIVCVIAAPFFEAHYRRKHGKS
jgi:hypothetical protein